MECSEADLRRLVGVICNLLDHSKTEDYEQALRMLIERVNIDLNDLEMALELSVKH